MSKELSWEYGTVLAVIEMLNPCLTTEARGALIMMEREHQKAIALKQAGIDIDVLSRAYDWTIDIDGELHGLTAGDMGYEPTGIKLNETDSTAYNRGIAEHLKQNK
jgi:hypothetical protein